MKAQDLQRKLLAEVRRADTDFNLINDGDKILVGVSGGKDSILLCFLLNLYQKFGMKNFEFKPVMLDLGFEMNKDFPKLEKWFEDNNMPLYVSDERQVYKILSIHKKKDGLLPCSICSRMKKAAINAVANKLGYNKVCFAHHGDDAIETLFMNMVYGGKVNTFEAKMHLEKANITFIRPLIYTREAEIKEAVVRFNLPVLKSHCPNDQTSKRADFKELVNKFYTDYPASYDNFLNMLTNREQLKLLFNGEFGYSDGHNNFIKKVVTKNDYIDSMYVRRKVFIEEQGISLADEMDELDKISEYYNFYHEGKIVGTIRYYKEDENTYHFGRFAVLKEHRASGYGTLLFKYLIHVLSSKIVPLKIRFSAQYYLKDYYVKLGFKPVEDFHMECGIKHVNMEQDFKHPLILKDI